MKFSIEGFDQNQLISLGCDIADAMILRWLVDFAGTGLMRTYIKEAVTYYMVNYDAVLEEFPILGISTVKGISKRFDKLVENGLLLKHIRHGASTTGGTTIYFALTGLVTNMLYSQSKISVPVKNISEKNCGSVRESQTKASEKNCGSFRLEPEFLSPGTRVPFALNNPSISNPSINSSTTTSTSELKKTDSVEAEGHIVSKLKELFGGRYVFDGTYSGKLQSLQVEFGISNKDFKSYLDFVMAKTIEKKPKSITNMFFKMSQSKNMLQDFVLEWNKKQSVAKETEVICPVCGNVNHAQLCSVCNFDINYIQDENMIRIHKQIYALPSDMRIAFGKDYAKLQAEQVACGFTLCQNETLLQKFKQRFNDIYKKYGIIA